MYKRQCLDQCLTSFDPSTLQKVVSIGVCGQMHGCGLWKSGEAFLNKDRTLKGDSLSLCSTLITWQDGCCFPQFLSSLPKTSQPIQLSTGYGCATLAWLKQFKPDTTVTYEARRGQTTLVQLPIGQPGEPGDVRVRDETQRNKGVRVKAEGDKLLTVYGINDADVSTDAFLALSCHKYPILKFVFSTNTVGTSIPLDSRLLIIPCEDATSGGNDRR